jgi:Cu/Ag efflux protein CusF
MRPSLSVATIAAMCIIAFVARIANAHAFDLRARHHAPHMGKTPAVARYTTHGTVKSIGPNRETIAIAHDDIPGFMSAMTMSFTPKSAEQLAGLQVEDRVTFTFLATEDHRYLLEQIRK